MVAQEDGWIYFSIDAPETGYFPLPHDTSSEYGFYKMRMDGSERTKLCDDVACNINVVDDWIYYQGRQYEFQYIVEVTKSALYKMRTDGSERIELDNNGSNTTVVDDWIYYSSDALYKIRTDGSEKIKLNNDDWAGAFILVDDWIYYGGDALYKMRTDGSNKTKLSSHSAELLYVVDGWLYYNYLGEEGKGLYRIRTDGSERTELISGGAGQVIVANSWIYYHLDDGIYRIRTDGSENMKLLDIKKYVDIHNVVDDWIYYSVRDYDTLFRVRTDGSDKVRLSDEPVNYIATIDGWIYYYNDDGFFRMHLDGSGRQQIG